MLEAIRKSVSGILAKILIGLLIISFAIWGIGDMVRSYGRDVVAKVGDETVNTHQFRQAYQIELDNIAQRLGRRLRPQEAKAFGIDRQVLARLTGAAAIDNQATSLDLSVSEKQVEESVYTDPIFQDANGTYSPAKLNDILRRIGYSDQQFFESRRKDIVRNFISDSVLANVTTPKALTEMLLAYEREKRVAQYIDLSASAIKLPEPTADELKKTYENHKRRFVVPEYRKVFALLLTADAAREKIEISDAELKTRYESEKSHFTVPEMRTIEQIPFPDKAKAEAALAEIKSGKSFADVAKANNVKPSDMDLGTLTRAQMIDDKIAAAAFALKKDEVSGVVEGQFKPVLLKVTKIEPGKVRPFDAVKEEIRTQVQNEQLAEKMQALQNAIDDNRLAGKSLKDIAKLLDLPSAEVAAVDKAGKTPDGKPAFDTADSARLVASTFNAEVGVENAVTTLPKDGLAWVNLIAVTPEKQKPYDQVKDEVKKTWVELETASKLAALANKLADDINKGDTTLGAVAAKYGVKVETTPEFRRGDSLPGVPPAANARVFALADGQAAAAAGPSADRRLIMQVTKVIAPKGDDVAITNALANQVQGQLQSDTILEYITALQKRFGVSINSEVVDQTTGSSGQDLGY